MTSNNQVSPVIRISRGERDASARATHLKAASKKYLETTIERKQMSTTTNFKRIALVAVAALGLGVLSSVPSQATINADSVTLSSATAAQTTAETYTATSAIVTVDFFGAAGDSMTLTAALTKAPAGSVALPILRLVETSSAIIDSVVLLSGTGTLSQAWNGTNSAADGLNNVKDSSVVVANRSIRIGALSSTARTTAKYAVYLVTPGTNTNTAAPTVVGAYEVKLTPAAIGVGPLVGATAQTLTINVTAAEAQSTSLSATNTKIWMQETTTRADLAVQDSTVVARATASTSAVAPDAIGAEVANIWINGRNAANIAFNRLESVTATISGAGILGATTNNNITAASPTGRSILVNPNNDYVVVFSDGTSGAATVTFTGSTSGTVLGTKTVTFSGVTVASMAAPTIAATDSKVIEAAAGTYKTTTVSVKALDAAGNLVAGLTPGTSGTVDFFAFSSDTAVATVAYSTYSATTGYAFTVTGVAAGSATISFGNASSLVASTIKSTGIAVRVGTALPSNVTVTTDKATYAPGEKMTVTVTILDLAGNALVGRDTYANIFSATGIVPSASLSGTNTLPNATNGTAVASYSNTTNTKTYEVFAPVTGGPLTLTWTGGTALATANQVAKTVTVTVTDSGAAALAAVTALATTVASLRTLIVTLTNLVLKIQKKVRA
jgi:protocatechuate 3,4-dioxygenase beta subunit